MGFITSVHQLFFPLDCLHLIKQSLTEKPNRKQSEKKVNGRIHIAAVSTYISYGSSSGASALPSARYNIQKANHVWPVEPVAVTK